MTKFIPVFNGKIQNSTLHLEKADLFKLYLSCLEGQKISVVVKKYRKHRSKKQNSLYWVWLTFIGNEIGEDPEDLHQTFKAMFLVDHTKKLPIVRSTTTLNTAEFMEYMAKIERRVSQIGITLPSPEEFYLTN